MLETFLRGLTNHIKKEKKKGNKGVQNAKIIEERVTQSPNTPSTKALIEVSPYIVLHVNDPMPISKPHDD
jgi:hypothetical protein